VRPWDCSGPLWSHQFYGSPAPTGGSFAFWARLYIVVRILFAPVFGASGSVPVLSRRVNLRRADDMATSHGKRRRRRLSQHLGVPHDPQPLKRQSLASSPGFFRPNSAPVTKGRWTRLTRQAPPEAPSGRPRFGEPIASGQRRGVVIEMLDSGAACLCASMVRIASYF
jgi:hypothetical protein